MKSGRMLSTQLNKERTAQKVMVIGARMISPCKKYLNNLRGMLRNFIISSLFPKLIKHSPESMFKTANRHPLESGFPVKPPKTSVETLVTKRVSVVLYSFLNDQYGKQREDTGKSHTAVHEIRNQVDRKSTRL